MKQLTLHSVRNLSDEEWKLYKEFCQLNGIEMDWKKLEETGKAELTQHQEGEDVITYYELKTV